MTIEPVGQMSDALTTANLTTSIADSNTNVGIVGLEIYVPKKVKSCFDLSQKYHQLTIFCIYRSVSIKNS